MAITYPRPFFDAIESADMRVDRMVAVTLEAGGDSSSVTLGWPRWRASFQTGQLREPRASEALAWLDSLREGQGTFLCPNPIRRRPWAARTGFAGLTRAGGGAWDGTASAWRVSADRGAAGLDGLPAGFQITVGDCFGLAWEVTSGARLGPRRHLFRFVEGGVANGSGATPLLTIEPPINPAVPANAAATLDRPTCIMRMEPGSSAAPLGAPNAGRLSWRAVQTLGLLT